MSDNITVIPMPKWGLSMTEGTIVEWMVEEGDTLSMGEEIVEIETSKITNVFESPTNGTLRRITMEEGDTAPIGAMMGLVAEEDVSDEEIDAFIAAFQEEFAALVAAMEAEAGIEPELVEAGGRSMRYLRMGPAEEEGDPNDGDPLLLLHGFGGDLNNWMFNQPSLAESSVVYALDLPGHGGSSKDVGAGDVASMSDAVIAFMDAIGIQKAHLAGHSMGGAVALNLALSHPDRAASVTLVCSAGLGAEINGDYISGFVGASKRKELKPVAQQLFADASLVTRDLLDDLLKYKRIDGVQDALDGILKGTFNGGGTQALVLADRLGELKAPVQAIWGAEDQIVPVAHAAAINEGNRHILAGAGHMVHLEKAADVNRLLADFIAKA
jgi:pyruvate dehydrogenase E2 component (dihydrolipoamide acetyltransferase)